ncbi:MAG TPA: ParB N-terminal domain-containing protein [Candidatus Methanofastidiosa archaeon]|nr:ParB N-terminal domain-containing protein [Candidatus Methanofastidiosa archaeon]
MGVERWSKVKKPLQIMKVDIIPLEDVKCHEEVIEEELQEFIKSLKAKGIFYRPILVDRNSLVVLDGHHRVEGLRRLGAKKVPAILLDYDSDDIKLYTWYPIILGDPNKVVAFLKEHAKVVDMEKDEAMSKVDAAEALFCILPDKDGMSKIVIGGDDLLDKLEENFSMEYVDTLDFLKKLDGENGVLLYRRSRTKKEVIERAMSGEMFPPKTTRHYLPFRYQDIRIKINHLF